MWFMARPKAEQHGFMRALASRITRLALGMRHRKGSGEKRERVSRVPHTIARGICRLSDSFCFHRRVAYMGNNALPRDARRFPAAPFGLFKLQFHKAGSPCTRYDDRLQHGAVAACQPDWIWMHVIRPCSFPLRLHPLLPGRQRAGISISSLDNCDLFRRTAFRPGSHRRIPRPHAFSDDESTGLRYSGHC